MFTVIDNACYADFGGIMGYDPLDFGELQNLADLYVTADHERNFSVGDSGLQDACDKLDLVAIFDAECELVCLVPQEKANLMMRLINTYEYLNADGKRSA